MTLKYLMSLNNYAANEPFFQVILYSQELPDEILCLIGDYAVPTPEPPPYPDWSDTCSVCGKDCYTCHTSHGGPPYSCWYMKLARERWDRENM